MTTQAIDVSALRHRVQTQAEGCFGDDLERAYAYVDRLCLELCFRLAREHGLLGPAAEPLADVRARLGVAPHAMYLLDSVLAILAEEGFARQTQLGWEATRACPPDASADLQRQARAACPAAIPTFELIARCHAHAGAFLTGRVPGLPAIFPQGDLTLWERVHTVDRVMSIYADLIVPALAALAPRQARLLELGAGVGAVLGRCLAAFDQLDVADYWFTDIGPTFIQRAQQAYSREPRLRFTLLDVDGPLRRQGLAPDSFDVVIAVNVLHVAKRLAASLREVGTVLKPGGYLVLAEGSPPRRGERWRLDVVYAFLRGWWDVVTEPRLRPRPGFLLPSEWERVLLACGYEAVLLLPGEDWFSGPVRGGLIIARRPAGLGPGRLAVQAESRA
jgi:SAM-dependent methyltransferase